MVSTVATHLVWTPCRLELGVSSSPCAARKAEAMQKPLLGQSEISWHALEGRRVCV